MFAGLMCLLKWGKEEKEAIFGGGCNCNLAIFSLILLGRHEQMILRQRIRLLIFSVVDGWVGYFGYFQWVT